MKRRAFTLIEMLIVMGVMAILLALSVPRYLAHIENAEMIDMKADMRNVQREVATYTGEIPLGALTDVITAKNARDKDMSGPFYKIGPIDYIPQQDIFVMNAEGEVFYTVGGVEVVEESYPSYADQDFVWVKDKGYFWYKSGRPSEVIIPYKLRKTEGGEPEVVTSYESMFHSREVTKVVSTSNKVTNMRNMFEKSYGTSLDVTGLNTSEVITMIYMFKECKAALIDMTGCDTSKLKDLQYMFSDSSATEIKLFEYTPTSGSNLSNMFRKAKVSTLDLSTLDISNIARDRMNSIFYNCSATEAYAKTQADADKFGQTTNRPSTLTLVVK